MRYEIARPDGGRIDEFEGLRGLLAWWVVLGHVAHSIDLTTPYIAPVLLNVTLAVDIFIILSGFVIARLIDLKSERYLPYITRRAFRIFPLYLVVLFISAALLPYFLDAVQNTPFQNHKNLLRVDQAQTAIDNLGAHLATHIPLLQGLLLSGMLEHGPFTIVGQAWSVSLEWQFYLLAPVILLFPKTYLRMALLLGVFVALFFVPGASGAFLGIKMPFFGIGILSYLWAKSEGDKAASIKCALLLAGICLFVIEFSGLRRMVPVMVWGAVCALIYLDNTERKAITLGRRFMSLPVLVHFGDLTYAIYLVHMIPIYMTMYFLNSAGVSDFTYGVILFVSGVGVTYAASLFVNRFVEKPGMAMGRKVAKRLSGPTPSKSPVV